jgi:DNA polymerase-3 subunit chi
VAEVFFYHLQRQPLERVLPILLEKCREREWKVVVQADSDERIAALDDLLWTYADASFLPHGTEREGNPERQPILLTTAADNGNGAEVRVLVDGVSPPDLAGYVRALLLFDGNDDDAVATARDHWRTLKEAGHEVAYWQQDEDGRWQRRA